MLLCTDLLSEISSKPFPILLKPIEGQPAGKSRSQVTRITEYAQLIEDPVQSLEGEPVSGALNWIRRVDMHWVNTDSISAPVAEPSGLLRITVSVERNGVPLASASTLRSVGGDRSRWGTP